MHKDAVFSDCRKYRYQLVRIWDESLPNAMFIGLNPSTANEHTDDATIRRIQAIGRALGYGGVYMCNCFPYISTDPAKLKDFGNTLQNDFWLVQSARKCKQIFFAWGNFDIVKETGRDKELQAMFPNAMALVINKNGSPRHPLYVPTDIKPVTFTIQPMPYQTIPQETPYVVYNNDKVNSILSVCLKTLNTEQLCVLRDALIARTPPIKKVDLKKCPDCQSEYNPEISRCPECSPLG